MNYQLNIKEYERLLFVLYEHYERHPNDYDLSIIYKLREIIRYEVLPF